jgi:hypothetical protein
MNPKLDARKMRQRLRFSASCGLLPAEAGGLGLPDAGESPTGHAAA